MLRVLDKFMVGHKGFICGGCFKNIFNHEKVKDIDIFFLNHGDYLEAVIYLDENTDEFSFYYENKNVKAYRHKGTGIVVELVCKTFGTVEQILELFDFTITKFAYFTEEVEEDSGESHIEHRILVHKDFFEHLHMKRLVVDSAIPYPMSTFERMIRYIKYGYMPCHETKLKIIKALREISDREVELSNNFYNGLD